MRGELALPAGGRHVVADLVVENDDARRIALLIRQVGDRCGQISREIELVDTVRPVRHRCAGIEQQRELRVGLAAIALQIHALGSGENVPVDVPQVVAFGVGAVLGELLAEAEVRRTVQTRTQTRRPRSWRSARDRRWKRARLGRGIAACMVSGYLRSRLVLQEALHDVVRIHFVRLGVEVQQDAVTQNRRGQASRCLRRSRDSGGASERAPSRPERGSECRGRWRRS